jgi:hypothetical protein
VRDYVADHHAAMDALDEADAATRRGDDVRAKAATRRALVLEARAAANVPPRLEPTRSVLYRSAASIAVELGETIEARRLASEGLRGEPPAEIKAEIFHVLDRIDDRSVAASNEAHVVQQLRIRNAPRSSRSLTIPIVAQIQSLWIAVLDELTDGMSQFIPVAAGVGSFIVKFQIQRDDRDYHQVTEAVRELANVAAIVAKPRAKNATSKDQLKRLEAVRRVVELLSALAEADAVLEVTTQLDDHDPIAFDIQAPTSQLLRDAQSVSATRVPSGDVPQANDLEKVFRFVELVHSGEYPTPDSLDIVGRQVNYYRRAAEILGYLKDGRLTPGGRLLARASKTERWQSALERFTASDVGSAWIEWSEVSSVLEVDPTSAADFLRDVTVGLSEATVKRRAASLESWHEQLQAEVGSQET